MKKILISILTILLVMTMTGCSNTKELEGQIITFQEENKGLAEEKNKLQEENKKLIKELNEYKDKEKIEEQEKQRVAEEKSKYKNISFNELIVVEGYGEFTIKSAELTQKVMPPNPSSFYNYYEVKDPNEIYLDVIMDFKNTTTIGIGADEVTNVKVIYGNGYEYSSFSTLEESGGSDFTYTNINKVEPLKSIKLHYLATLPVEAKNSQESIKIQFTVYGSNYELNVR